MAPQESPLLGARPTETEATVDVPSVAAGDPIAYAARRQAEEELLEAAKFAVRWFREREQHAPPESAFGGEAEVEARLKRAIRRVHEEEA
jgi:hypothetical protein